MKAPAISLQSLRFVKSIVKPSYGRCPAPKYIVPTYMVHEQWDSSVDMYFIRFINELTADVIEGADVRFEPCKGGDVYKAVHYGEGLYAMAMPAPGTYRVLINGIMVLNAEQIVGQKQMKWRR